MKSILTVLVLPQYTLQALNNHNLSVFQFLIYKIQTSIPMWQIAFWKIAVVEKISIYQVSTQFSSFTNLSQLLRDFETHSDQRTVTRSDVFHFQTKADRTCAPPCPSFPLEINDLKCHVVLSDTTTESRAYASLRPWVSMWSRKSSDLYWVHNMSQKLLC